MDTDSHGSKKKSIKFGVLGLGFIGKIHALNALKLPGSVLAAVADPDPTKAERFRQEIISVEGGAELVESFDKAQRYDDGNELLNHGDLDAVIICLPTHLHETAAKVAFDKGLHVLCEKPIALTVESADAMIDAAQNKGRILMVAQCIRFWPEYLHLREIIASGEMGKMVSLNLWRISGVPDWAWENWFLDLEKSGGPLVDLHIHDIDFAYFILGMPDDIFASGRSSTASDGLDIVHTLYEYKNGPQVHLHAGWSTGPVPFNAGFEAWFEKGFMRFSTLDTPSLSAYEKGLGGASSVKIPQGDAYAAELAYFKGCIQTGVDPALCPPQSSRDSLSLARKGMKMAGR